MLSDLFVFLVGGGLSPFLERQLNGPNELNQVAVKQSEVNESAVVLFSVVVFSFFRLGGGVFSRHSLKGGSVFPPPPFGWAV